MLTVPFGDTSEPSDTLDLPITPEIGAITLAYCTLISACLMPASAAMILAEATLTSANA